jgi:hypothetical protein
MSSLPTDDKTLAPSDSISTTKPITSTGKKKAKPKRQSEKKERVPLPTSGLPLPLNLSTKASPLKDVFCIDEFETIGLSLRPTNVMPEFQVEHAGYMNLVEVTYDEFCYTDRHFRQNAPRSVYNYYHDGLNSKQIVDEIFENLSVSLTKSLVNVHDSLSVVLIEKQIPISLKSHRLLDSILHQRNCIRR